MDQERQAEELAGRLLAEALETTTAAERRRRARIGALIDDPASRAFLLDLTDQVLRIRSPRHAAARLAALGVPPMAGPLDRASLRLAGSLAGMAPAPVVALARARLRHEVGGLVIPWRRLRRHLVTRRREGFACNVNVLGEAVLGEDQARARTAQVVELLGWPEVEFVSVKLSALYSQLDVLAYDHSLAEVSSRLEGVLRAAGTATVTFDMEEYRDLHLTVDAFCSVLDRFPEARAGIALQAYLPDTLAVLKGLCWFARRRRSAGGAPIRVRLVKGANLAMEQVESELHNWPQAPYTDKTDVDANYKRLLDTALGDENAGALVVGVASHNLFDVAWALVRDEVAGGGRIQVEMLEGMAGPEARAVLRQTGTVLLYVPVEQDFDSAVAYLVRRFDENTAPENFLARLPTLAPSGPAWDDQRRRFAAAVVARVLPPGPPRRPGRGDGWNEPDTDFTAAASRGALVHAQAALPDDLGPVHELVGAGTVAAPLTGAHRRYRYVQSDRETVAKALEVARSAAPSWAATSAADRRDVCLGVARLMAAERLHAVALMGADSDKTAHEADPEVSEAVDHARNAAEHAGSLPAGFEAHGVVTVTPPWNFPYAIPTAGVLAALAAGNAVVLKPAPETVATGALIVDQCHRAGVPPEVLQLVPTADDEAGRDLVTGADAVVLTGAWETARMFLGWNPEMALHAETSGKNALVVTAAADQEDAVRDLVRSAFSHSGQKCSAASLAVCEAAVYDDRRFLDRLRDAVASLVVGPAEDPATSVGPLIRPPAGPLQRVFTRLEPGERWLVEPRRLSDRLWSPGVKLGVQAGSEFHMTECFGPVLGLMRAGDLDHALELQNAVPYGLTGGIWSLDDDEVGHWLERVQVGNAYVNRPITGAVVRRQPFGGWKRSSVGPGAKAGGPTYVASMGRVHRTQCDPMTERAAARALAGRLLAGVDTSGLRAESNVFRLRPLPRVVVRLGGPVPDVQADRLAVALGVAEDLGVPVELSSPEPLGPLPGKEPVPQVRTVVVENDGALAARLVPGDRVRLLGVASGLRLTLMDAGAEVDVEGLSGSGEVELSRATREQAVSRMLHRHGNVRDA